MKAFLPLIGKDVARWVIAVFAFDAAHKVFTDPPTAKLIGVVLVCIALLWAFMDRFFEWRHRAQATPTPATTVHTMGGKKLPLVFLLCSGVLAQGCFSMGPLQETREKIADLANKIAYQATRARLRDHRGEVSNFSEVSKELHELEVRHNYEPTEFAATLRHSPIQEYRGDDASLLIGNKVKIWEPHENRLTKVDDRPRTKTILSAVYKGISQAINEFTPPIHP